MSNKQHTPVISNPSTLSVSAPSPNITSSMGANKPSQATLSTTVNGNSTTLGTHTTTQLASSPNISSVKPKLAAEITTTKTTDYKFEDYEEIFFNKAIINDPLKISVIPDLLNVVSEGRLTQVVGNNTVPEDLQLDKLPKGTQESINVFQQHWNVINRESLPTTSNVPLKKLESLPYIDTFDAGHPIDSVKDLNTELLQVHTGSTPDQKTLDFMKGASRVPIFKTIPPGEDELSSIEPPKYGKPILDQVGFQFTVECTELKPQIGNFEPFFGRMFLFDSRQSDLKSGIVSEEFHFDLSQNLDILPKTSELESPTKIKKALFQIANRSNSIHLIVCFDKVILGDPEETTKTYFNPSTKQKELQKFTTEVREGVARLGHFRQPFIWGCIDLFDANNQFVFNPNNSFQEVDLKLTNLVKSKGDLLNFVTKEKKSTKDSVFDCNLKFQQVSTYATTLQTGQEIYNYNDQLVSRIDHLLRPKKSKDIGVPVAQQHPMVKEILQFDYQPVDKDQFGKDSKDPFIQYSNVLYFYPKSVNLTNYKSDKGSSARNIFLEVKLLEDDTNVNNLGIKNIYGNSLNPILTRKYYSQVSYHNRKPKFTDEIKINLPANLTPNHHLLITFYHLGCRQSKKSDKPEVPLGYTAIRLFENDQILFDNKYKKPVATVFPPKYLLEEAKDPKDPTNLKMWVDNKKPVFSFRTRIISSIYPQDTTLSFILRNSVECEHNLLNENIKRIDQISPKLKSQYFPAIFRVLFKCITNLSTEIAHNAFVAILNLCDSVSEDNLSSYVTYIFNASCSTVTFYDSLVQTWNHFLEVAEPNLIHQSIQYSWFLFGLIKKSMVLEIDIKGTLKSGRNRNGRFSDEVLNRIKYLFDQLLIQLKQNYKLQLSKFKSFIVYIGHFINDLLDITNRGFVFKLIHSYVTGLDSSNTVMELVDIKSRFFRVLAMNDSFIALNLPMSFPFPSTTQEIYQTYYKKHFLVGLLLQEISTSIIAKEREVRITSVQTLREIMSRFDNSANYNSTPMRERIASLYFPFILILIDNYNHINSKFEAEELKLWLICFIYVVKNLINSNVINDWWKKETLQRKTHFFDLLDKCAQSFEYAKNIDHFGMSIQTPNQTNNNSNHGKTDSISSQTNPDSPSRRFKKGSTYVASAKANNSGTPGNGRSIITPDKAKELIEQNIQNSVSVNKSERTYSISQPTTPQIGLNGSNSTIPNSTPGQLGISAGGGSSNSLVNSTSSNSQSINGSGNNVATSPGRYRSMILTKSSLSFDVIPLMLENLTHEVSLTVLNCIVCYIREFKSELLKNQNSSMLESLFQSIISILSIKQSHLIVKTAFCILSSMINEFKTLLFKMNNTVCADLTEIVFYYSYSSHAPNRQYATTLVYLLIHNNLKEMGNFSRMKLQSTIAISNILNESLTASANTQTPTTVSVAPPPALPTTTPPMTEEEKKIAEKKIAEQRLKLFFDHLYSSLNSICKFVKLHCNDSLLKSSSSSSQSGKIVSNSATAVKPKPIVSIQQQMEDLSVRLNGVIKNNEKIQQHSYDPEMKADLFFDLANTFIESPDLRITWLKSLSAFLNKNKNYEEAAQVNIITAALISGYLKMLNRYPKDIVVDFSIVSPNIVNELTLPDASILNEVEGEICKLDDFTEAGFINLLKEAIYILKVGCFFESCADAYRLLLPTYQRQRDWQKQIECYNELRILCVQIIAENTASQRIFSNYYRVAFYCKNLIPDIHEKEFIYKELNFTRLSDVSQRLQEQYGAKFGEANIHLLPNNKPVDKTTLDPNHLYIQIVSVDPYLLPEELSERISPFEQNTNLNKFIFEIPFNKNGGKPSEKIDEQWKKKIILTTKSYFPYCKKRIPIVSKKELELTPIEAAIELLQKKIVCLRAELNAPSPNTKTLQINLQGILLLQVNAGPLAICNTFLAIDSFSKYNADHITKLTEVVKEFTNVLGFSLKLNKQLSKEESPVLVEQLDLGYQAFRDSVGSFVELGGNEE